MNSPQSTLDTIDQALVECDASRLPPIGHTCLRPGCTNGVLTWLNPYYCTEKCRADVNDPDELVVHIDPTKSVAYQRLQSRLGRTEALIGQSVWSSIGWTRHEDLPEPDAPVSLGWDPAGGAIVAVQHIGEQLHVRYPFDTVEFRDAFERAAESVRQIGQAMTQAGFNLTERHSYPEPMRRALELRRNRNTGPQQRQRAPRRIEPTRGIW